MRAEQPRCAPACAGYSRVLGPYYEPGSRVPPCARPGIRRPNSRARPAERVALLGGSCRLPCRLRHRSGSTQDGLQAMTCGDLRQGLAHALASPWRWSYFRFRQSTEQLCARRFALKRTKSLDVVVELLRRRQSRWQEALHVDRRAVDQLANLWCNDILPVFAFVHGLVQPLALRLICEAPHPDVDAVVLLAAIAPGYHHSVCHLEGNDLLLHALKPGLHFAGPDRILSEFVECHHSAPIQGRSRALLPGRAARLQRASLAHEAGNRNSPASTSVVGMPSLPDAVEDAAKIFSKVATNLLFLPTAPNQRLRYLRQIRMLVAVRQIASWNVLSEDVVEAVDALPAPPVTALESHLPVVGTGREVRAESDVVEASDVHDVLKVADIVIDAGLSCRVLVPAHRTIDAGANHAAALRHGLDDIVGLIAL